MGKYTTEDFEKIIKNTTFVELINNCEARIDINDFISCLSPVNQKWSGRKPNVYKIKNGFLYELDCGEYHKVYITEEMDNLFHWEPNEIRLGIRHGFFSGFRNHMRNALRVIIDDYNLPNEIANKILWDIKLYDPNEYDFIEEDWCLIKKKNNRKKSKYMLFGNKRRIK